MTTRRRFFGGAVALAAPLAASAAIAADHGDDLAARLAALEDANAIRALLQDYARQVSAGSRVAPAASVRGLTLEAGAVIDVAANKATVRVPCTVATATPIVGYETAVEMARLQGDGVIKRSERRTLAATAIKHDGIWTLEQTELTA